MESVKRGGDTSVADGPLTVAGVQQPMRVAGLAYGAVDGLQWGQKERWVDFFDVKGDVQLLLSQQTLSFTAAEHPALHPGRCAKVHCAGQLLGHVGELHPRWRQAWELPQAPVLFELVISFPARKAVNADSRYFSFAVGFSAPTVN